MQNEKGILEESQNNKRTPEQELLLKAVLGYDSGAVSSLIKKDVDVIFDDENGNTPFYNALNLPVFNKNIIDALGDKIVSSSFKILEKCNECKSSLDSPKEKQTFLDGTICRKYELPLSEDDINNILKFQYSSKQGVFKAIKLEHFEEELEQFKTSDNNLCTFIISLGNLQWITLVVLCIEENKFDTYYSDSSFNKKDENIKLILKNCLQNENELIELKMQDNAFNCGVFALDNAKIINDVLHKASESQKRKNKQMSDKISREKLCDEMKAAVREELINPTPIEEKRKYFANMLFEKMRTEKKIKSCLDALEDLNKTSDNKCFNYKSANVFILFLEAFALQDTYLVISESNKNKQDKLEETIRKFKKLYFKKYFNNIQDFGIIEEARKIILHSSTILKPQDLNDFLYERDDIDEIENIDDFFKSLQKYTLAFHNKLCGQEETDFHDIQCKLPLFKPVSKKKKKEKQNVLQILEERKLEENSLLKIFFQFIKKVYGQGEQMELKELDQVLFDLTVNIIPILESGGGRVKELCILRNKLVHCFQDYKNNKNRLIDCKREIWKLRSLLFKYYFSREVHHLLISMPLDKKLEKKDFSRILNIFEENLRQNGFTFSEVATKRSFEHVSFKLLFSERDDNTYDFKKVVEKYLRFVAVFDDEKRMQINDDENENSENYRELSDVERREIFEEVINLEEVLLLNKNCEKLKTKLIDNQIATEDNVDEYIKSCTRENNALVEKAEPRVTNIVKRIMNLKNSKGLEKYDFLNQDIISLCDHYIKEKYFDLKNHKDFLIKYGLSASAKKEIENMFRDVINKDEIIYIPHEKKQINVAQVVTNILKTVYNAYCTYEIKFDNVEGAFSDKIFLEFLVNRDEILNEHSTIEDFRFEINKYNIYWIIKKLQKEIYTTPYITSLIIKFGSDEVIEEDDLKILIKNLFRKDSFVIYLSELLGISTKKTNFNLYEVVCDIYEEEYRKTMNHEIVGGSMYVLLCDSKHAQEILKVLGKKIDSFKDNSTDRVMIESTKTILTLLNNVVLELIYKGKNDCACKILGINDIADSCENAKQSLYQKLVDKHLIERSNDLIVDNCLNIAKLYNVLGKEKAKGAKINRSLAEEAKALHKKALKVLYLNLNFPKSLLVLSRKAYTHSLLQEYDKSCEEYNNLYNSISKLALGSEIDAKYYSKDIYTKITNSKNYHDLLGISQECNKYLNISSIIMSSAFSKLMQDRKNIANVSQAIEIYKKVISFPYKDPGHEYRRILPARRMIMYGYQIIASKHFQLMFSHRNIQHQHSKALHYNLLALEESIQILKMTEDIFGIYSVYFVKSKESIVYILFKIAKTNYKLTQYLNLKIDRKTYNMFENVLQIVKETLRNEHDNTEEIVKYIHKILSQ